MPAQGTTTPPADRPLRAQFPEEAIWLEIQKQSLLSAPGRVNEGGKQIITLSTVLAGAYFTAVAFANLSVIGSWPLRVLHVLPVCFWSLAILLAISGTKPPARCQS